MGDEQRAGWIEVGAHAFREEPEERILYLRLMGDVTVEDVHRIAGVMEGFSHGGRDSFFLFGDLSAIGNVGVEARKALSEVMRNVPICATAGFGASFTQRVIATLADRLTNVLRGERRFETHVFVTEEESRAWLAQERLRLAKPS